MQEITYADFPTHPACRRLVAHGNGENPQRGAMGDNSQRGALAVLTLGGGNSEIFNQGARRPELLASPANRQEAARDQARNGVSDAVRKARGAVESAMDGWMLGKVCGEIRACGMVPGKVVRGGSRESLEALYAMNLHEANNKILVPYGYAGLIAEKYPQRQFWPKRTIDAIEALVQASKRAQKGDGVQDMSELKAIMDMGGTRVRERYSQDESEVFGNLDKAEDSAYGRIESAAWFSELSKGAAETRERASQDMTGALVAYGNGVAVRLLGGIPKGADTDAVRQKLAAAAKGAVSQKITELRGDFFSLKAHLDYIEKAESEIRNELRKSESPTGFHPAPVQKVSSELERAATRCSDAMRRTGLEIVHESSGLGEYLGNRKKAADARLRGALAAAGALDPRHPGCLSLHLDIRGSGTGMISIPPTIQKGVNDFVANAVKYTNRYGEGKIFAHAQERDGYLRITVTNLGGIGIKKEDLGKIGSRGFRTDETKGIQGTGDGIAHVDGWVRRLGGFVVVSSGTLPADAGGRADDPMGRYVRFDVAVPLPGEGARVSRETVARANRVLPGAA